MAALTFLQMLQSEVARMQTAHPERLGELARAHALIRHGQVLPSAEDPQTGQVLSSDGQKTYTVNGVCDCQAGQHGKPCKHLQSWRLYQYIARKVEALPAPGALTSGESTPLPEAPVSITLKASVHGFETLVTLRGADFASVQAQVEHAAQWLKAQAPQQGSSQGKDWCSKHGIQMKQTTKDGRSWWSHKTAAGWCKGK